MTARFAILLFLGWLCAPLYAQTEDYAIDWFSLDCGGGTSADGFYSVSGTIGQPAAGEVADNVYSVTGGFWAAALAVEPPSVPGVPVLSIARAGSNLIISWPAAATGFSLEENMDLFQSNGWHPVSQPVVQLNGQNTVTVPASDRLVYYRLTDSPSLLRLTIARNGANVILSWPAWATSYSLEQNLDATQPKGWSLVGLPVVLSNTQNTVTLPVASDMAFFRLTQTPVPLALMIARSGNNVILSWPASATGYFLERTLDVTQPNGWLPANLPVVVVSGRSTVTVSNPEGVAFFRLTRTPSRPALTITHVGSNLILSWPASTAGYYLEQNLDATQPGDWSLVNLPVVIINGQNTVTVPVSDRVVFYRLTDRPSGLRLMIARSGANVVLAWPASAAGYFLEHNSNLSQPNGWSPVNLAAVVTNGWNSVTAPAGSMTFYRLTQPGGTVTAR